MTSQTKESKTPVKKICFNPSCNEIGTHWINIIGRVGGYEGGLVPYLVCDNCSSFLGVREQFIQNARTELQDKDFVVKSTGIDIQSLNPFTAERMITTKDMHELLFQSGMSLFNEQYEILSDNTVIEREPAGLNEFKPVPKICFNKECENEGTHWMDIVNTVAVLGDHEVEYYLCNKCYSFFDYKRKEAPVKLDYDKGKEILETVIGINLLNKEHETITTRDCIVY